MAIISVADKLSVYPGIQQIVGLLTVGSNVGKLGLDLIKSIYNLSLRLFVEIGKQYEHFNNRNNNIVSLDPSDGISTKETRSDFRDKKFNKYYKLHSAETNYSRHFEYLGIGVQRAIPVWGTYLSLARCRKVKQS